MVKHLLDWFLNRIDYYNIYDLQAWGHCGLCGNPMEDVFLIKEPWGICDDCLEEGGGD